MGQLAPPQRVKGAAAAGKAQEGMKKRKAVRILLCQQEPVRTGERFHLDVQVRVPVECRLLEIDANVEGRCRAAFDGHDNLQTLVQQPLDLRPLSNYVSKGEKDKGKDKHPPKDDQALVIPAGIHRVVCPVVLPQELPGTFKAKYGAIAYRAIVKVRIAPYPKGDEIILEGDKTIDVLGSIALDSFPRHDAPVLVDQHFVRSFLCFSRMDVKVNAEIERSAYRTGEHVLVSGTIENGQPSTVLKNVNIELRQLTHYTNGTTKKSDDRLIASLSCGACDINSALKLHHSLQIPANVFPSLVNPNSAVQVFYELHITGNGDKFRVEVPLFVGNRTASSPAASSGGRKSRPVSGVFTRSGCSSYCSSYGEDTTYSSGSDDRDMRSEDFVRVHAPPPPPPFMPAYGLRQMPPFFPSAPPRYGSHHQPPPPPAYKPFLKIEEITDD